MTATLNGKTAQAKGLHVHASGCEPLYMQRLDKLQSRTTEL